MRTMYAVRSHRKGHKPMILRFDTEQQARKVAKDPEVTYIGKVKVKENSRKTNDDKKKR